MKKLFLLTIGFSLLLLVQMVTAADLATDEQRLGYAIGVYFSKKIIQQHKGLDKEAFTLAVDDVLNQRALKLTPEEVRDIFIEYERKQQQQKKEMAEKNKIIGEQFLSENEKKKGVTKLPSGLQYKILKKGDGVQAKADSKVSVHYRGTLVDGSEFDSSYSRGQPATFHLNQVIKGWQEIVPLMQTGAKWEVYVPYTLAYGEHGAVGSVIGPYSVLIFEIELLEVH